MSNDENTPIEPIDVKPELPLVPSTSSDPTDRTAPTVYADDIFEGARYRDYHHFRAVLTDFEKRTHTAYKNSGGSEKLYSEDYPDIVAKYIYKNVNVECVHFGVFQSRSKYFRHYDKYKAIGCESRMKLHYRWATQDMELTRVFLHHNHVCAPPQLDANGKEQLPEIIGYSTEIMQLLAEFKDSNARRGGRPSPYSRPTQTLPIVSTEPSPSLERLNQELLEFLNPENVAEREQIRRNQMKAQIKLIHDNIPQHETQKRNGTAMQLMPASKIVSNNPRALALKQIANETSRQ